MADFLSTLSFDAVFAAAAALVYAYVGRLMLRRRVGDEGGRLAMRMFAVWWFGLALLTLMGATRSALAAAGILALGPHLVLSYASLVPLVACLWGLLFYLLYIYTGRRGLFAPLGVFHAGLLVFYTYLTAWLQPQSVRASAWSVSYEYGRDASSPLILLALILLVAPTLLAALAYGSLLFRAQDRTTRYRVSAVSTGFLLWFGSAAVATFTALGSQPWWPPVSRVVGLVATVIVLAAYRPPRFLRDRLGVAPVELEHEERKIVGAGARLAPPGFAA